AERALQSQLDAIEAGVYSNGKFPGRITYREYLESSKASGEDHGDFTRYLQGALVTLEANTGYIRAMVGGRDFDDSKFNRATQARRQPGSTFKPVVYSAAIQHHRPPTYILDDSPLSMPQIQGDTWAPQNYDLQFEGQIPMRRALYESRNIPAIRLGMELGEQTVVDMAHKLGISTPIPLLPSIHIGAADVYPIEMVAAFSTFATLGTQARAMGITKVENAK